MDVVSEDKPNKHAGLYALLGFLIAGSAIAFLGWSLLSNIFDSTSSEGRTSHTDTSAKTETDEEELGDHFIGYMTVDTDGENEAINSQPDESAQSYAAATSPEGTEVIYGLGDTFEVNGIRVYFGNDIKTTSVTNQFSDYYGNTVIGIPITETNLKQTPSSFNHFWIAIYSPSGNQLSTSIGALFPDSIIKSRDMMPNASQTSYVYFLHAGPGTYHIYIDDYSESFGSKIHLSFSMN